MKGEGGAAWFLKGEVLSIGDSTGELFRVTVIGFRITVKGFEVMLAIEQTAESWDELPDDHPRLQVMREKLLNDNLRNQEGS